MAIPTIVNQVPVPDATSIVRGVIISFSIRDAAPFVVRTSIRVYVNGDLIYNGAPNTFAEDWLASSFSANAFNGFDFVLISNLFSKFDVGQIVTVRVVAEDDSANQADVSWSFTITTDPTFRLRIYDMLLGSVRKQDGTS